MRGFSVRCYFRSSIARLASALVILPRLRRAGKIQNNDVEKLAGVSNATAERYLDELEKEGKLTQHGVIGQGVFYTFK